MHPMTVKPPNNRIEILDPLRGLAAAAVAWYHFTNCSEVVQTSWLRASGQYGWLGVDIFFVISGFIIPYSMYRASYEPTRHFGRFLVKRLLRLEPPYLASIVLALSLMLIRRFSGIGRPAPEVSAPQILLHLGYLNTFFGYRWLNEVYWTLGIEFQYYLLLALLYPLLVTKKRWACLAAVLALPCSALVVDTPTMVFHFLGLFAMGMLVFQLGTARIPRAAFVPALALITALTAFRLNSLIAFVGCATALAIALRLTIRHRGMAIFVYLGNISYSLYLLHGLIGLPIMSLAGHFASGLVCELTGLLGATTLSLLAAAIFYRFVELPAQALSARIQYPAPKSASRCATEAGREEPSDSDESMLVAQADTSPNVVT